MFLKIPRAGALLFKRAARKSRHILPPADIITAVNGNAKTELLILGSFVPAYMVYARDILISIHGIHVSEAFFNNGAAGVAPQWR